MYAVRVVPEVSAWMEEEYAGQETQKGAAAANAWERGLLSALASLATFPWRCAVAAEDLLFPQDTLRLLLYPLRRGGPAWRILFTVREGGDDAPVVYVL